MSTAPPRHDQPSAEGPGTRRRAAGENGSIGPWVAAALTALIIVIAGAAVAGSRPEPMVQPATSPAPPIAGTDAGEGPSSFEDITNEPAAGARRKPNRAAPVLSVEDLVDKINTMALEPGDRYRVTGMLTGRDFWKVGATGDFFVMLETGEGSDLQVMIDEARTRDWRDGMLVEFMLETVDVEIDGETHPGFQRARSARVV